MGDDQWYTNRDLFEMVQKLADDTKDLRSELRITREAVRKYNNLRETIDNVAERIDAIEQQAVGRYTVGKAIREWGGWIIAVVTFLYLIFGGG